MIREEVIELHAGSTEDVVVTLSDEDGEPITTFAGWSATVQVRYAPSMTSPVLFTWSTANDLLTLVPGAESAAVLAMPDPVVSLAWEWRLARFDLAIYDGGGNPAGRPVRGIVRVVPGITR